MLNILQSYHEATGDPRAIEVMTRFMKWENTLPETAFGEGYWPKIRAGDNIESALWLYNRSGEAVAAGPGPQDPSRHGPLGPRRHRLAQRQPRAGLPRRHGVRRALQGGPRSAVGRAELPDRDGALRAAARRRVRGRRELPARVPRSAGRHRDLRDRGVHAQFRDAHADHRPAVVGRSLRGDRAEQLSRLDDARPEGPALHHRGQPGPTRPEQQVAGHPEWRDDVFLQSQGSLPLLPAQRLARLALLCGRDVAGHAPTTASAPRCMPPAT